MNAQQLRGVGLDLCRERIHDAAQLSIVLGQLVAHVENGDGLTAELFCIDYIDAQAVDQYPVIKGTIRSAQLPDHDGSWELQPTPEGAILVHVPSHLDCALSPCDHCRFRSSE